MTRAFVQNHWISSLAYVGPCDWTVSADVLESFVSGHKVYFPINFLAGSRITSLGVKFEGYALDSGVKIALLKRNDGNVSPIAFSIVGAETQYLSTDRIIQTYNCPDTVIGEYNSYLLRITSVAPSDGVSLIAINILTDLRLI